MIEVREIRENTFEVTVTAATTTTHRVTVDPVYWKRLTGGKTEPQELVRKSFEFLLEREPNTSILSSFALPVIGRYFPEYEKEVRKQLSES